MSPSTPLRGLLALVLSTSLALACATSEDAAAPANEGDAGTVSADAGGERSDGGAADARAAGTIPAADYCETIATPFCAFYMRCGRMVAADETECRKIFLETCNAKFEPRYVDLEEAGLLALSSAGAAACADHLAAVTCAEQASDLDGPCARMWTGTQAVGKPCGLDVESFVCGAGATCILGLDFCGTCEAASPRGGPCETGKARCSAEDACVAGTCVARSMAGQPCSDTKPCLAGAACTAGTCVAPSVVGEGEACDSKRRCAYRAVCDGASGKCVRAALLGEPCASSRGCVSGRCDVGRCVSLRADGETCATNSDCSSAQCTAKVCTPLPTACIRP